MEESASVAIELTKRGGRGERGGGMDMENVREFLRQVETLPCKVPEAKLLEVVLYIYTVYILYTHFAIIL